MSNPLLLDIALFLKNAGLVVDDGVDLFRDFTPEEPNNLVALHEYSGTNALLYDPSVHRSVQILCRNNEADLARQKALSIYKLFVDNQSQVGAVKLTDDRWGQVFLRQTPFKYKIDENNRVYYVFNIGITTTVE